MADSKTKYWVSDNSSYNVSYGSPGNYDDADLARADNDTDYIYRWSGVEGGSPLQSRVELDNKHSSSSPQQQNDSIYSYDEQGQLTEVDITGVDNPRNVKLLNDINGQVLQRTEVGYNNNGTFDPQTRTYFFGGRQQGEISTNGTGNNEAFEVNIETSIVQRQQSGINSPCTFKGASNIGASYALGQVITLNAGNYKDGNNGPIIMALSFGNLCNISLSNVGRL